MKNTDNNEKMKPKVVDLIFMAFPADVSDMLPSYEHLATDFKSDVHPMCAVANHWMFYGLKPTAKFHPKPGIKAEDAFRHIQCCLGSFQPKHEHKIAGVAFLLDLWFEKIEDWELTNDEKRDRHTKRT